MQDQRYSFRRRSLLLTLLLNRRHLILERSVVGAK